MAVLLFWDTRHDTQRRHVALAADTVTL
jgi:hypothetical protein